MTKIASKYWLGVAALEHVESAVEAGICQFGHGRMSAVKSVSPDDWIVYYSPKEKIDGGRSVQAFTAIGQVAGEVDSVEVDSVEKGKGTHYRRDVRYLVHAKPAEVRPLLPELSFVKNQKNWGLAFRLSKREISSDDFHKIASAMGIDLNRTS